MEKDYADLIRLYLSFWISIVTIFFWLSAIALNIFGYHDISIMDILMGVGLLFTLFYFISTYMYVKKYPNLSDNDEILITDQITGLIGLLVGVFLIYGGLAMAYMFFIASTYDGSPFLGGGSTGMIVVSIGIVFANIIGGVSICYYTIRSYLLIRDRNRKGEN